MSRIDRLIWDRCPNGVPHPRLGEVGEFIRGRRFTKADRVDAGLPSIHYGEIYTHYGVSATEAVSHVDPALAPALRFARQGDVIFAAVGETIEDVGKAVAWLGDANVAVHDDCFIFRSELDPRFVAYFTQSAAFNRPKESLVASAKVKRLSGESLASLRIPVPPLEVQREIVRILDHFTELESDLEAQLTAELAVRRRQHAFYRDHLLTFAGAEVDWTTLGEIAIIGTGSRNSNEAVLGGRYPFFVRSQEPLAIDDYEFDETAIITAGDGVGVGKVFHYIDGQYGLHQRAYRLHVRSEAMIPKFLFHYIRNDFGRYLAMTTVHGSVASLRKPMFESYPVPVPRLEEQARIVAILDNLDALMADLGVHLPAELAGRRKQYEHYRDRLLAFGEPAA